MLESMILHPRPTRAETSDVANAIIDGTDAVMLSGETASGGYPVEAVRTMVKIALDVERSGLWQIPSGTLVQRGQSVAAAVAEAACHAAAAVKARAIVVFTQSGSTAALISKNRPQLPIIAFAPSEDIRRRLSLYWGVRSLPVGAMSDSDQQIALVDETLLATGVGKKGDVVVITMGVPLGSHGSTNLMKVHTLGSNVG
jgi:pyruvate kinase